MKKYCVSVFVFFLSLPGKITLAQQPVNSFSTVTTVSVSGGTLLSQVTKSSAQSVNGILPNSNYTVNFNNNGNVRINSFGFNSKTFVQYAFFDTVIIRRAANAWETSGGNKQHIFSEGTYPVNASTTTLNMSVAYPQVAGSAFMERVMKEGFINRGSDNVFNNDSTSDLTFNNIERVDFVYKNSIITPTNKAAVGFLIAERGGNDPFKIAAITAVDASGNPTAFGNVVSVATTAYGAAAYSAATHVLRKDVSDNTLRPFSVTPVQTIKCIFVTFADLGLATAQRVYGYALMGNDVAATTGAQVLDYTNTTYFPRTTNNANGGMDLASAPGIFHTDMVLAAHALPLAVNNNNCLQTLTWQDADHQGITTYEIEKSFDSEHFTVIGSVSSGNTNTYSFTDRSFSSACYYRIRAVETSGSYFYSSVIMSKGTCSSDKISVFPNPVVNKLSVTIDAGAGVNRISLFSVTGKQAGSWNISGNTQLFQADITALPAGHYYIQVAGETGVIKTVPVIKM